MTESALDVIVVLVVTALILFGLVKCQLPPGNVPLVFGKDVPGFFGKDVPALFGRDVPPMNKRRD